MNESIDVRAVARFMRRFMIRHSAPASCVGCLAMRCLWALSVGEEDNEKKLEQESGDPLKTQALI